MSTILDDTVVGIARCVRDERENHGWSLAELADRSGVSRAMISKIERAEASPTATVLVRLAAAFDLTIAGLLLRAQGEIGRSVRAQDQPRWRDPETGFVRRQVFARQDHPVELTEVELPAGARVAFPAASYAFIRQVVWVLEGQLTVEEGGEARVLDAGDSLGFGAPKDCVLANDTDAPCRYLVTLCRR